MTVLGIDVGGTKLLAAHVELGPDGPLVLSTHREPVPHEREGRRDREVVPSAVAALVERLLDRGAEPEAIGLGLAGYVDTDGIPALSPNVPQMAGVDVGTAVQARCGLPVVVDNDANCVALATAALRRPEVDHLIAVTLGTGIGGAVMVDGRLVRGAHGFAGEPGHMVVDPSGPLCPCGQRGCWERYASGAGLEMLARREGLAAGGDREPGGEAIVAAAARGEPAAEEVLAEFAEWVALGIGNLLNLLDPELVVVGGGLSDSAETFLPAVRDRLRENPTVATRGVPVESAPGGSTAGAVGGALLAGGRTGGGER